MKNKNCQHKSGTYAEGYLNSCRDAGCNHNGPFTYHCNCRQQYREYCVDCDALISDTADDEIEYKQVVYMCGDCAANGVQQGHSHCGEKFWIPA